MTTCDLTSEELSAPAQPVRWTIHFAALVTLGLCVSALFRQLPNANSWELRANNPNVAEGIAWLNGHTALPARLLDTAVIDGRVVNVYPPAVSFASAVVLGFQRFVGLPADVWWPPLTFLAFPVALVLTTYWAAFCWLRDPWRAVVIALFWVCGTPLAPVTHFAARGEVYWINHLVSQIGLALVLADVFRRRVSVSGGLGFLLAVWSRQMTALFAIPLILAAWKPAPRKQLLISVAAIIVAAAGLLITNTLRTGAPFDFGYAEIYVGRTDSFAQAAASHGLWSWNYFPQNFWALHVECPFRWDWPTIVIRPNEQGASVWATSPLLIVCLVSLWRGPRDRVMFTAFAAAVVIAVLQLRYHNSGASQFGFARFTLDFLPAVLMVGAVTLRKLPLEALLPLVAFSIYYFQILTPMLEPY